MIKILENSSVLNVKRGILMHQVNCRGFQGGLAKKIFDRWPQAFKEYHDLCGWYRKDPEKLLGTMCNVWVVPKRLCVCNFFGQVDVGGEIRRTDYDVYMRRLPDIERQVRTYNMTAEIPHEVHIPYMIGCGLANGDIDEMMSVFEKTFKNSSVTLNIHRWP